MHCPECCPGLESVTSNSLEKIIELMDVHLDLFVDLLLRIIRQWSIPFLAIIPESPSEKQIWSYCQLYILFTKMIVNCDA